MLPNDFPPWQTVYWWFRRFVRRFMFQTIHDVALMLDRERVGREARGVVDSQSVKAPEAKTRGYDAGKKIAPREHPRPSEARASMPVRAQPWVERIDGRLA